MLRGRTRVLSACQRCRKHKIRCSGIHPCRTCHGKGLKCDFGAEEKQVQVSERELFELKTRVKQLERNLQLCRATLRPAQSLVGQQHAFDISAVDTENGDTMGPDHMSAAESAAAVGSSSLGAPSSFATSTENSSGNPLVPDRPSYITENSGRIRWLGHSSTYAFTQKVFQIVQHEGPSNPTPEMQMSNDGRIYTAETDLLVPMKTPDVSNLPSKATAMHYLEVIKFRTKPLFYLFDDTSFTAGLDQFYRDPVMFAGSDMIWFAHLLVLMALGKSLDPHSIYKSGSDGQVSVYFTRALQMLPDMTYLCGQNMTSTELLCSIALYLQSVDHRQAAMLYITQAVRMAQLYALNLDLEESVVGNHEAVRGRRIWWTVYALDKKLTLNQGLPNIIDDRDIRSPWPRIAESDEDRTAMAIHTKMCRLVGKLMSHVYSYTEDAPKSLISTVQAVLEGAADVNEELRAYKKRCFGEISRVLGTLELTYHHCIIIACRPALYSLLRRRFEPSENPQTSATLTPSMTGLLQACVDSAGQTVQFLSQLEDAGLLDTFLPFDLEYAFSAAFVLIIAEYVHPKAVPEIESIAKLKTIIDCIGERGSVQARLRKMEIDRLAEQLRTSADAAAATVPATPTQLQSDADAVSQLHQRTSDVQGGSQGYDPMFGSPFFDEWNFGAGLSAGQIMDLAGALDDDLVYFQ